MTLFIQILGTVLISFFLMQVVVPAIKKIAYKFNLTDKPNIRKLHAKPIPLIGGISIALSVALIEVINFSFFQLNVQSKTIIASSVLMLFLGVVDDKFDVRATYKLAIQLFCGFLIAASGNRLVSLYGLFGVYEIPILIQYIFTIVIYCGVVNSFNLMDGIDGLAGVLGILGFSCIGLMAFITNNLALVLLASAFIGSLISFIRFNYSAKKIFMGDAGSLFIGSLLIGFSIYILNHLEKVNFSQELGVLIVIGFFSIPVLDSLRVYLGRLKRGISPFKADKTHIHHLFLLLGLPHKQIVVYICSFAVIIITLGIFMRNVISIGGIATLFLILFSALGLFLNINKKVAEWRDKLKALEN